MQNENVFYTQRWYGYIKKEDYNNYLSNELSGVLLVLNPYEEGKSIAVKSSEIGFIEIGLYQDLRNK